MNTLKRLLGADRAHLAKTFVASLGIVLGGCQSLGQPAPTDGASGQKVKLSQQNFMQKIAAGWKSHMKVVGDPQYGVRTQGWLSTNVTPPMNSMVTPGGYKDLEACMEDIYAKADHRLEGALFIGTPASWAQPLNVSGPQGLRSLLQQEVNTPVDSVLSLMDQNNLNAFNQQITIARNATENGENMTMEELLRLAPYPVQDMTLLNGVPNILRNLVNMADTLGGTSPANSAILGHVMDISGTYARIADARSKVVTDQDLAGYTNPVTNDVQQRSLADQSGFNMGNSAKYGPRALLNNPVNVNNVYAQGEPYYVQKSLLKNAIIMADNIHTYKPLPTSRERLESAAMTLDSWDWNTVQLSPEDLFSRMVTLSIIYAATPEESRPGSLADMELQRQKVLAQAALTNVQTQINYIQNGNMPGVPAQAQPQPIQPHVGPAHQGSFVNDVSRCLIGEPKLENPNHPELPGGR